LVAEELAHRPTPTPIAFEKEVVAAPNRTAAPASTPKPKTGYSRSSPAEIGADVFTKVGRPGTSIFTPSERDWSEIYEVRISVTEIIRGEAAWERILTNQHAQDFYDPPGPEFEYLLAMVRFDYLKGPAPDILYEIQPREFAAVSSDGREYDQTDASYQVYFDVRPEPSLHSRLYAGASFEGLVEFQVVKHDSTPVMTFGRDERGRGGIWFKLFE